MVLYESYVLSQEISEVLTYFSMPDNSEFNFIGMPLTERAREYHSIIFGFGVPVIDDSIDPPLPSFSRQRERTTARSEFRTKASYRNRGRKRRTFRDLH